MQVSSALDMIDITVENFLCYTTFVFGAANSGKTTMIKHILRVVKPHIASIYIINPTNHIKHDYDGIAPNCAIYKNFDYEMFKDIKERQEAAAARWTSANQPAVLERLFARVASNEELLQYEELKKAFKDAKARASDDEQITLDAKNEVNVNIFLKNYIRPNVERLLTIPNLSKEERYSLEFINFTCDMLFIFDDCSAEMKEYIGRDGDLVFGDAFYRCRHLRMTLIFAFHDDTNVCHPYKKNAFNTIFCKAQPARAYFGRASSFFSAEDKRNAEKAITNTFVTLEHSPFQKLWYSRNRSPNFRIILAQKYDGSLRIGSRYFWQLYNNCEKKDADDIDPKNPYCNLFALSSDKKSTRGEYY